MIAFLGYVLLGVVKIIGAFVGLVAFVAIFSWVVDHSPLTRLRLPAWVPHFFGLAWRVILVIFGIVFFTMFAYVIGGGPQL